MGTIVDTFKPKSMSRNGNDDLLIEVAGKTYEAILSKANNQYDGYLIIVSHGAGGDMHLPQLETLANKLTKHDLFCVRFTCRGMNLIHRTKVYRAVVEHFVNSNIYKFKGYFLAGRSMGARAAVTVANSLIDELSNVVYGVICMSYPLHTPTDTSSLRDKLLLDLNQSIHTDYQR